jgi:hypothetical protein
MEGLGEQFRLANIWAKLNALTSGLGTVWDTASGMTGRSLNAHAGT